MTAGDEAGDGPITAQAWGDLMAGWHVPGEAAVLAALDDATAEVVNGCMNKASQRSRGPSI